MFPFNKLKLNSELNQLYVPLTKNKKTDEMLNSVTSGVWLMHLRTRRYRQGIYIEHNGLFLGE